MLLLADQMVPDAVSTYLRNQGHEVRLVREALSPEAPDLDIARLAHQLHAIVVTWNVKHFDRFLCRAPRGERIRFRHAGMMGFTCPEVRALTRIKQAPPLIEHEHELLQKLADKRLFAFVSTTEIRIVR